MNKTEGCFLLVVLALALSPAAFADNRVGQHPEVPQQTQKAAKEYNKQLHDAQKQQSKALKKQMKELKKRNPQVKDQGKSHS